MENHRGDTQNNGLSSAAMVYLCANGIIFGLNWIYSQSIIVTEYYVLCPRCNKEWSIWDIGIHMEQCPREDEDETEDLQIQQPD